jgi:putative hemolysin
LEFLAGAGPLRRRYRRLPAELARGVDLWAAVTKLLELQLDVAGLPVARIPASGPLLVVVNHPFGVVDGVAVCRILSERRRDFKVMAISLLSGIPEMAPWVLPIDFTGAPESRAINLRSRAAALEELADGRALVMFPAGEVATAPTLRGAAVEAPWHPFASRLVAAARADVLPVHVAGQNSWRFHLASRIGVSCRLAMLMHETNRLLGGRIRVTIGEPIRYGELERWGDRRELADRLRSRTLSLACQSHPTTA